MKLYYPVLIGLLFFTSYFSLAQDYDWGQSFVNSSNLGNDVFTDANGNVYCVGEFNGIVDFQTGLGTLYLISAGSSDAYVTKSDSSGVLQWAKRIGGTGLDKSFGVGADASGNVYITGSFSGTADFDPSGATANLTSSGAEDVFVLKLSATGAYVWSKKVGGSGEDIGKRVVVNSAGNVIIAGTFNGTVDFDPGAGTDNITSGGSSDGFVLWLNSSGNYVQSTYFDGSGQDDLNDIALDNSNNLYLTGSFRATCDFNPSGGTGSLTSPAEDIFIVKLNALTGNYTWAEQFGENGFYGNVGYGIATDALGDVYAVGKFSDVVDFNPAGATANMTSNFKGYLLKLTSSGSYVWADQFEGGGSYVPYSVSTGTNNEMIVGGSFNNTVDFSIGGGTSNVSAVFGNDMFICRMTSSGGYLYAYSIGDTGTDHATKVHGDGKASLATGQFYNNCDFDPSSGVDMHNAGGVTGTFLVRYKPYYPATAPVFSSTSVDMCLGETITLSIMGGDLNGADDWYWYDNGCGIGAAGTGTSITVSPTVNTTYFVRGEGTSVADGPCASIIVNVNSASASSITETGCDSYVSPSGNYTWTTSGVYNDTILNAAGCDSIMVIDLTINSSSSGLANVTACNDYYWDADGQTYSISGVYNAVIPNAAGCDSTATLSLNITALDVTVTDNGDGSYTANEASATAYQWLDCDNGYAIISGATSQTFTPTANGNYAVEITTTCADTSACINVSNVGISEVGELEGTALYPNPTEGEVHIEFGATKQLMHVYVRAINGKLLHQSMYTNATNTTIELDVEAGVYFIHLTDETGNSAVHRVLVH